MTKLLLKNATAGGDVLIEGNTITAIGRDLQATEEIDLEGATLLPGFIDVHNHGAVGVDVMDATPSDLHRVSEYLASQGVTGWLPTFVPASDENYASAVAAISEVMTAPHGAHVLGVYYEGPFVNTAQCGALHTEYFKIFLISAQ